MTKKDLSDIIALMKLCGQWNDFTGSTFSVKFAHHLRHTFAMFSCILSIAAIFVAGFINSVGSIMYFSIMGSLTNSQSLFFFCNHDIAMKIIEGFQEVLNKHEHKWEDEIFHKDTDYIWKILNVYICCLFGFMVLYLAVPFIVDTYLISIHPGSDGYRVPMPFEGFLDPIPVRDYKYYLVFFTGIIWAVVSTTTSVGNQSLLCLFSVYLSAELKILRKKLRLYREEESTKVRTGKYKSPNRKNDNPKFELNLKELKKLIIHHQALMSIEQNMIEYFGFPFAAQNTLMSMCICLLLYAVTMDTKGDVPLLLTNIFVLFVMFALTGINCSLGQKIETESANLSVTLYDLPWYKHNPEFRKHINMMLRQAVRQMQIHYKGWSPLNLRTLMQIMNTSYSYFMVLKSTV